MSASCRFCGAEFSNSQAVRAHLKGCVAYQNRPARQMPDVDASRQQSLGTESLGGPSLGNDRNHGAGGSGQAFDPVRRLEQQIAAERRRLELREVEELHREMDRRAEAAERVRQQAEQQAMDGRRDAEREREAALRLADRDQAERVQRQAEESSRRLQCRMIIQQLKTSAIYRWQISSADLRAQALQDIESALSKLPVDELPEAELIGIIDGICSKALEVEREASQRKLQTALDDLSRSGRRSRLEQHGRDFAARELQAVEDLSAFDRARIMQHVTDALEDLTGDETKADIEMRVEAILEREGLGWEDDDENEDDDYAA